MFVRIRKPQELSLPLCFLLYLLSIIEHQHDSNH